MYRTYIEAFSLCLEESLAGRELRGREGSFRDESASWWSFRDSPSAESWRREKHLRISSVRIFVAFGKILSFLY